MTYFKIICSTKIQSKFGGIRGINVTNTEKAGVMLHIGASHSNNNAKCLNLELIRGNLSAKPLLISTVAHFLNQSIFCHAKGTKELSRAVKQKEKRWGNCR